MEGSNAGIRQFVVFKLGNEEFGVDIQNVTIIEQMMAVTRVPGTPAYIRGVLNLRGEIIPAMDTRKRFNMPEVEEDEDTRIVFIKTEEAVIGMIVDSVSEVLRLPESDIEGISAVSSELATDFVTGVGKYNNRIISLLNAEKLASIN